jgi:hypothetical protein
MLFKQHMTFHADYSQKSYTEYQDGEEILHVEYDLRGNKIYYRDYTGYWYKRQFEESAVNNTGEIIYFEDSTGVKKGINLEFKNHQHSLSKIIDEFNLHM